MAPRYSLIPGDFVDDPRPRLAHYRVILALGRRTNRAGWCMVSQTKLAVHLNLNRVTINNAISDLVSWGYVERRGQVETRRAICQYRVLLDRAMREDEIDDGVSPDADPDSHAPDADQPETEGDVSSVDYTGVSSTDYTRVVPQTTRGVVPQTTPITIPGRTTPLSQRERESGWAKGWDDATRKAAEDLERETVHAHVATAFIAAVRGTLNPPAHVDGPSFVRQLRSKLTRFDAGTLAEAAEAMTGARSRDLPAAADIEAVCAAAKNRRAQIGTAETAPVNADADPATVARTPELHAGLRLAVGPATFDAWFAGLIAERIDGANLRVSLPNKFKADWVRSKLLGPVEASARTVFPAIRNVEIVQRQQPSRQRAA